jgi:hypothetical protein
MRCKSKTHFEQVQVETIKKIAKDYPKRKKPELNTPELMTGRLNS